jgi:hypothetical protein
MVVPPEASASAPEFMRIVEESEKPPTDPEVVERKQARISELLEYVGLFYSFSVMVS